jgi:hypothetical protein
MSASYGLATVDLTSLKVTKRASLLYNGELTGGGDARLFMFEASQSSSSSKLYEIDQTSFKTTQLTSVSLSSVVAFAFSRYMGSFYIFTATGDSYSIDPTKTTIWDPTTKKTTTRDSNIGFTVVGAGQSTCVQQVPK